MAHCIGWDRYQSCLTECLGWLLEKVSGVRYQQLLETEIWSKIGKHISTPQCNLPCSDPF